MGVSARIDPVSRNFRLRHAELALKWSRMKRIAVRRLAIWAVWAASVPPWLPAALHAQEIRAVWEGTYWGEPSSALVAHFGRGATALPWRIDFGDSYSDVVLRNLNLGGYPFVVFFQMDKVRGGLKRIQIERQRHGVNPPAFRAIVGVLDAELGVADASCEIPPGPASGYQAATELAWRRDQVAIRAIFRDTTIEAFEGCLSGDPSFFGPCGLTGQLLVRISPPDQDSGACPVPAGTPPGAGR